MIIEELIDGELKGIVGGESITFSSSDIPPGGTISFGQSTTDEQNGNERTITTARVKNINGAIETKRTVTKYVNGVQVQVP